MAGGITKAGAGRGCGITTRRGGCVFTTGADVGVEGAAATGGALAGAAGRAGGGAATATTDRETGGCGTGTVWRGSGEDDGVTMRGAGGATGIPGAAVGTGAFAGGRLEAGATVTGGRAGGGVERARASACLRSRMAFSASPGLDTWERLNSCRVSACGRDPLKGRLPRLTCPRTFSASSSSMELECVFFSVTPTAVRASRMVLLLTSSSRARSLIRTLLIRSFSKKTSLRA